MRATNLIDATVLGQPIQVDRAERENFQTITFTAPKPKHSVLKKKVVKQNAIDVDNIPDQRITRKSSAQNEQLVQRQKEQQKLKKRSQSNDSNYLTCSAPVKVKVQKFDPERAKIVAEDNKLFVNVRKPQPEPCFEQTIKPSAPQTVVRTFYDLDSTVRAGGREFAPPEDIPEEPEIQEVRALRKNAQILYVERWGGAEPVEVIQRNKNYMLSGTDLIKDEDDEHLKFYVEQNLEKVYVNPSKVRPPVCQSVVRSKPKVEVLDADSDVVQRLRSPSHCVDKARAVEALKETIDPALLRQVDIGRLMSKLAESGIERQEQIRIANQISEIQTQLRQAEQQPGDPMSLPTSLALSRAQPAKADFYGSATKQPASQQTLNGTQCKPVPVLKLSKTQSQEFQSIQSAGAVVQQQARQLRDAVQALELQKVKEAQIRMQMAALEQMQKSYAEQKQIEHEHAQQSRIQNQILHSQIQQSAQMQQELLLEQQKQLQVQLAMQKQQQIHADQQLQQLRLERCRANEAQTRELLAQRKFYDQQLEIQRRQEDDILSATEESRRRKELLQYREARLRKVRSSYGQTQPEEMSATDRTARDSIASSQTLRNRKTKNVQQTYVATEDPESGELVE